MKYALLIYERPGAYDGMSEAETGAIYGEYMAVAGDPRCVGGEQLQPVATATTVVVQDGRTLTTDGPFADTKEVFGGYFLIDAPDLDQVIELAERCPAARLGGKIEVRPLVER